MHISQNLVVLIGKGKYDATRARLTYCWWAAIRVATIVLVDDYWISSVYEFYI